MPKTGCQIPTASKVAKLVTLTGKLEKIPAKQGEDYTYRLLLDKPFYDELQSSGDPNVKIFPLVPSDPVISLLLDKKENMNISVSGTIKWGIAESRYLFVEKVN